MSLTNNHLGKVGNSTPLSGKLSLYHYTPIGKTIKKYLKFNKISTRNFHDVERLKVLYSYFNIQIRKYKRMPAVIRHKFGADYLSINKFIDSLMQTEVGSKEESTPVVNEVISGTTAYGDGYKVVRYGNPLFVDVFIYFNRYDDDNPDFKYRILFSNKDKNNNRRNEVMCSVDNKVGEIKEFCRRFTLFSSLSSNQFQAQCLLLSVVEKIPQFKSLVRYHENSVFKTNIKYIREKFKRLSDDMKSLLDRGVKVGKKNSPKREVQTPYKADYPYDVKLTISDRGEEQFVIKHKSGKEKLVRNDGNSLKNLYNATLYQGYYILHEAARTPFGSRFKSHQNESCWMDAFAVDGRKIPDYLIPYPRLKLRYLLSLGMGHILRGKMEVISDKIVHFDPRMSRNTKKVNPEFMVGMKLDGSAGISTGNLDTFFDDICDGIMQQTTVKAENDLTTNVIRRVSNMLNEKLSVKRDLIVKVCLTSAEKKMLCEVFPDIVIGFEDKSYSSHALFTAMRDCENYYMSKKFSCKNFIDAGGDVVRYLKTDARHVHVCAPVVDIKDSARQMRRSSQIDNLRGVTETTTMCNKLCQDCDVESQNIVAVQVYDMSLNDMADSIRSHKSKTFDFSIIIPPEIMEEDCDVNLFNGSLRVKSEKDKIHYLYGKAGEVYSHDIQPLRDILQTQIFCRHGVIYKKTLEMSRNGLHFFSVIPCENFKPGTYSVSTYYSKSETGTVLMSIPDKDRFGETVNHKVRVDRSIVTHLIEYVMNSALRVDDKAVEYLISQFRSRKNISIKGGKVVQIPFDLPMILYPGFLGIVLGEGLRLREKSMYFAKVSYYKHYMPSIFVVIMALLNRLINTARRNAYKVCLSVLRSFCSEDFINDMIFGDKRIRELDEIVEFKQTITVIGEKGVQSVMRNSFDRFIKESDERIFDVDKNLYPIDEKFSHDEYEVMRELISSGGGASEGFQFIDFSAYSKIFNCVSKVFSTPKAVSDVAGLISKLISYLLTKGLNTLTGIKELIISLIKMIRKGVSSGSEALKGVINRCKNRVNTMVKNKEDDILNKLEKFLEEDDEVDNAKSSLVRRRANTPRNSVSNSKELTNSTMLVSNLLYKDGKYLLSTYITQTPKWFSFDISSVNKFEEEQTESLLDDYLNTSFDLVSLGGGSKISPIEKFLQKLRILLKKLKLRVIQMYRRSLDIFDGCKEICADGMNLLKLFFLDTDTIDLLIKGSSCILSYVITSLIFGGFKISKVLFMTLFVFSIKLSGIEKKYIGYDWVTSQLSDNLFAGHLSNLSYIPTTFLLRRYIESKLKVSGSKSAIISEQCKDLIAKDLGYRKYAEYVTPNMIKIFGMISLMFSLNFPVFTLNMIIILTLLNDLSKYLKTVVVNMNVHLSYASILEKSNSSERFRKLKNILRHKFETKKKEDSMRDEDGFDPQTRVGFKQDSNDEDIEVVFDYDGSYTETRKPTTCNAASTSGKIDWADLEDDSVESLDYESLNFSKLVPTSDRSKFCPKTQVGLSNVILTYPSSASVMFLESTNEVTNCLNEFYYLETQRLSIELGKIDNLVRTFNSIYNGSMKFKDAVWHLRNRMDDSTIYISNNGKEWHRLKRGEVDFKLLEGSTKFDLNQNMIDFEEKTPGIQITSEEFLGLYTNNKCLGIESIMSSPGKFPELKRRDNVTIYNKPPGAGKTTTIVNNLLRDIKTKKRSIALTSTSAGKREIIDKLKSKGVRQARSYVRTYDAVLINVERMNLDVLYCDECFMIHSGQFVAVTEIIIADRMELYGDKNQIPYINRVPNTTSLYSFNHFLQYDMVHDDKSYRCPPDVCYILSNLKNSSGELLYPNGVKSLNKNANVLRSMEVLKFDSVNDLDGEAGKKYVTFTQPEKEEISRIVSRNKKESDTANTVNEVQGGTFKTVELVRSKQYDNPIYSDINQFIVSISRHTESMRYRTIHSKLNDFVGEKINALSTVSDHVIKEYCFRQRVDEYRIEVDVCRFGNTLSRAPSSHFVAVNEFMELINPGLSAYDYLYRTLLYEYEQYELPFVDDLTLDITRSTPYTSGDFLVPKILGKGERTRPDTWKQVLISLSHRNFSAPRINERFDNVKTAEILSKNLIGCMKLERLYENFDPVLPDLRRVDKWLISRDPNKLRRLYRSFSTDLLVNKFNDLKLMVKGSMKPKLDTSSYSTYTPPSNIVYYEQVVNMFYSPIFLEVFERIRYCMNDKIIMYSGMNLETLSEIISCKLTMPLNEYYTTEIDFSKFDKSQGVVFKLYEEMVYKFFKVSEDVYENIKFSEHFCRVRSRSGIQTELGAQRRTGSPNTWLSNTLTTMAVVLSSYNLDDIELFLVSGDDSLIFSKYPLDNRTQRMNVDFGMEAKFIENSVPYFCSKFIIQDRGRIKVIPDPVRFFEKLSVPVSYQDYENWNMIRERFISYKDLMVEFDYDTSCMLVDVMVSKRYSLPNMASYAALCYIHCLLANAQSFKRIYSDSILVSI
uniref:Polyprotein n=1 Tax=Potato yellow vein virus TaxID=103881 RepID=A0A3B8DZS0_9CLOS|nr:polyprotein [Potato yellow vein virus]